MKTLLCCFAMMSAAIAPAAAAQAAPGLSGAYYAANVSDNAGALDAIAAGTPAATFTATTICFPTCGGNIGDGAFLSDFLGAGNYTGLSNDIDGVGGHVLDLIGYLNIATAGDYAFSLGSDDGSRLYIDGVTALDNDGNHSFGTVSGSVALSAGSHAIRIIQFENGGETGLTVTMNGSALTSAVLSTTPLAAVPEPATWAIMIGGIGMMGSAMRRRRRSAMRFA